MKTLTQFREQAELLRKSSGSTNIEKTLLKALKALKLFNIPHYVCGGFAVQEHGYPRFTIDVYLIVPDVHLAREKFAIKGFKAKPGSNMTVTDRKTKVEVEVKALKALKLFNIPHYVCGGFAVQEHGYPRFTIDVV